MPFSVIPAEAGIQLFQGVIKPLDSGFHLSARHRQAGVAAFYEIIRYGYIILSHEKKIYHRISDHNP